MEDDNVRAPSTDRPEAAPPAPPAPPAPTATRFAFDLKAGDYDADLNKTVRDAVMVSDTFVIYLADDLTIQWKTSADHPWYEGSGDVLNRVAVLESRARFIRNKVQLESVKRQIAEGLVRCFDGGDIDGAKLILAEAEAEIQARNHELSWSWYFSAAYKVSGGCLVLFLVIWLARQPVAACIGQTAMHVLLGTLCGSFGALVSTTVRGNRIDVDANAGREIHVLEGLSRVGAGMVGAALVALAIKSGFLLGGTRFDGNALALLLMFCTVAGASERLVPNLIERVEKTMPTKPAGPSPAPPPRAGKRRGKAPKA